MHVIKDLDSWIWSYARIERERRYTYLRKLRSWRLEIMPIIGSFLGRTTNSDTSISLRTWMPYGPTNCLQSSSIICRIGSSQKLDNASSRHKKTIEISLKQHRCTPPLHGRRQLQILVEFLVQKEIHLSAAKESGCGTTLASLSCMLAVKDLPLVHSGNPTCPVLIIGRWLVKNCKLWLLCGLFLQQKLVENDGNVVFSILQQTQHPDVVAIPILQEYRLLLQTQETSNRGFHSRAAAELELSTSFANSPATWGFHIQRFSGHAFVTSYWPS